MPQKSLIIFDLDGTLANTGPDLIGTLNRITKPHGIAQMPLSKLNYVLGQGAKAMIEKAFQLEGKSISPDLHEQLFDDFLKDYEKNICVESHLYEGVLYAIAELSDIGYDFSVCTNKSEDMARLLLDELEVTSLFKSITGGDTFDFRKPDAKHLIETAKLAGKSIEDAIMIGDSKADIGAAINAGIPSVAVTFGYSDIAPKDLGASKVIDDFKKLPDTIREIAN